MADEQHWCIPISRPGAEDVKAGLRIVGRLLVMSGDISLDLRNADLRNADLSRPPKNRTLLDGAQLEGSIPPAT